MQATQKTMYDGACDCHVHIYEDKYPMVPNVAWVPPHLPVAASQMFGQVVEAPNLPVASQCLLTEPEQTSLPGAHSPAHLPVAASQTN